MKKTVESDLRQLSGMALCDLMDTCLPPEIEDERDMLQLIKSLWPKLVEHQECSQTSIGDFLEEEAPVYDNWQQIDKKYCCEKTLLRERERLAKEADEIEGCVLDFTELHKSLMGIFHANRDFKPEIVADSIIESGWRPRR